MLCNEEYFTAYIFFMCGGDLNGRCIVIFFMNKSMEGDGADEVWRRRKPFGPLHRINVK